MLDTDLLLGNILSKTNQQINRHIDSPKRNSKGSLSMLDCVEIVVEMALPVLLHSERISYHGGLAWCDGIIKYCSRACQILLKIYFSWKLITGGEKIEPFDVLNMGNISYFHLKHSNCYLSYLFKFRHPFISPKIWHALLGRLDCFGFKLFRWV